MKKFNKVFLSLIIALTIMVGHLDLVDAKGFSGGRASSGGFRSSSFRSSSSTSSFKSSSFSTKSSYSKPSSSTGTKSSWSFWGSRPTSKSTITKNVTVNKYYRSSGSSLDGFTSGFMFGHIFSGGHSNTTVVTQPTTIQSTPHPIFWGIMNALFTIAVIVLIIWLIRKYLKYRKNKRTDRWY